MTDEMFFDNDFKSLHRGKRRRARTPVCRPCLVWPKDAPELVFQGVVMDVNPFGMRIRMVDSLPPSSVIMVQLMRDEEFKLPLTAPFEAVVVRNKETPEGLVDHGVQIRQQEIKQTIPAVPSLGSLGKASVKAFSSFRRTIPRMHMVDIIVGDKTKRRSGR